MTRTLRSTLALAALLALGTATQTAHAQVYTEITDAGVTIPTSLLLPGGTTTVNGNISATGDIDLYAFYIDTSGTVEFRSGNSPFDDNLLLFNSNGQGIGASDDQGTDPNVSSTIYDSRITIALDPGLYYIAAGVNNIAAYTTNGNSIFSNDFGDADGVLSGGPTAQSIGYVGDQGLNSSFSSGTYTLTFSIPTANAPTTVPEPGSLALLASLTVTGTTFLHRRKTTRK